MNIILLGAPGSGKGTLAKRLVIEKKVAHISTGDLLREAVSNNTELGQKAKKYMDEGKLVPDSLIIDLMADRLQQKDCQQGYVLDGFPRTVAQAEALEDLLRKMKKEINIVLHLEIDVDTVVKRMAGRLNCAKCGAVYHKVNMPSKKEGICDACGEKLYQRSDDQEETVRKRFKVYLEQTKPLIDFYQQKGKLVTINGGISPESALTEALAALK
ncbi:MAG: adenylate kinase [Candidatus Margulisbacteria bacterium]|nr:adenylate kinase [Candidatus Margulisiibacteriota bacterium]